MTFEDLRKKAKKAQIPNDEYGIYLKDYTLYEDGTIYLNSRRFNPYPLTIQICIAMDRTPKQMQQFIESLL